MAGSVGVAKKIFKGNKTPGIGGKSAAERLDKIENKYRPPARIEHDAWGGDKTIGGDRAKMNMERRFPIEVGEPDPRDKMFDMQRQYVAGKLHDPEGKKIDGPNGTNGGAGGLGVPIFDESMRNYLAEKEQQVKEAEYESFAASIFNLDDPATAALVGEKILPEFYAKREAEIEKQAELQTNLAKIRLRGYPKDSKELALAFAIKKGLIKLPKGPVWRPADWSATKPELARGFFNPNRYIIGAAPYDDIDSIFQPEKTTASAITAPWLPLVGRGASKIGAGPTYGV